VVLKQDCSLQARGESWSLVYALYKGARPTVWVIGEIAVRASRLARATEHEPRAPVIPDSNFVLTVWHYCN
jgi:hypothetical protein